MLTYKENIITTGQYREVEIFPVVYHSRVRRKKYRPTTEAQQHINEAHSIRNLTRLIHTNFTEEDYALHLTYAEYNLPENFKECEKDIKNFILRLRRKYKKAEKELKYIYAVECSASGRWHAHLIINSGIDRDVIEKSWGMGFANADKLEFTENGVTALAKYIQKQHIAYKRWQGSRNLVQPKKEERPIAKKEVAKICDSWNLQSFVTERYPGYFLVPDDSTKICNPTNGLEYVRLFLCRTDAKLSFVRNDTQKKYKTGGSTKGVIGDNEYDFIQERLY